MKVIVGHHAGPDSVQMREGAFLVPLRESAATSYGGREAVQIEMCVLVSEWVSGWAGGRSCSRWNSMRTHFHRESMEWVGLLGQSSRAYCIVCIPENGSDTLLCTRRTA